VIEEEMNLVVIMPKCARSSRQCVESEKEANVNFE